LQVFRSPAIPLPLTGDEAAQIALNPDNLDMGALLKKHEESDAREGVAAYLHAIGPGYILCAFFTQEGSPDGMSLEYVRFWPDFPLYRHSHPTNCLYYILSGQVLLGSQTLNRGDGFFVAKDTPYQYKAGPRGCEVLEFRAGGAAPGAKGLRVEEPSLEALQRKTAKGIRCHEEWAQVEESAWCHQIV
jgi:hypothetical protein